MNKALTTRLPECIQKRPLPRLQISTVFRLLILRCEHWLPHYSIRLLSENMTLDKMFSPEQIRTIRTNLPERRTLLRYHVSRYYVLYKKRDSFLLQMLQKLCLLNKIGLYYSRDQSTAIKSDRVNIILIYQSRPEFLL